MIKLKIGLDIGYAQSCSYDLRLNIRLIYNMACPFDPTLHYTLQKPARGMMLTSWVYRVQIFLLRCVAITGHVGFMGNGDLWGLIFTHKSEWGFMGINLHESGERFMAEN